MRKIIALTIDVHGIGPEAAAMSEDSLVGRFGHGRYSYNIGIANLLNFLALQGVKATFFWPAAEMVRVPELFDRCVAEGHEIGSSGWGFEDLSVLTEVEEMALLRKAHSVLCSRAGHQIVGFRSATGSLSHATLPILKSLGYRYDSSFIDDDSPYCLAEFEASGMLELPIAEGLEAANHFRRNVPQGRAEGLFDETLDGLLTSGDFACMTLNTRGDIGVGRKARLAMVARVLKRARNHFDASILPAMTALDCWRRDTA
ncbi:polysaccharide deacetylase family protein [Paracoccus onubensis]|uniref:polysaccharide deacetylase family protein n=1 Tax=Paracoccus onubensis TaxID=1675788 RepID=UPI0027304783|nr:polysaccharide deacetylase family protein [Paracoccus onubensis]MDP0929679.1 polysaccharide deacetylase family protein [Paracoccus onubensis]